MRNQAGEIKCVPGIDIQPNTVLIVLDRKIHFCSVSAIEIQYLYHGACTCSN